MFAQYYRYTQDATPIVEHVDKLDGIAWMLIRRRNDSLKYNATDPRRGMPTGNDEADQVFWTTGDLTGKPADTELPYISIAAEMWRGFRDCGEALLEIADMMVPNTNAGAGVDSIVGRAIDDTVARTSTGTSAGIVQKETHLREVAKRMLTVAPLVLADLKASMRADATPQHTQQQPQDTGGAASNRNSSSAAICHPYVAGIRECGMLPNQPTVRSSEPWRTYSELLYSGALDKSTVEEILEYHQTMQGGGMEGSRLKLGVLAGCGRTYRSSAICPLVHKCRSTMHALLLTSVRTPFVFAFVAFVAVSDDIYGVGGVCTVRYDVMSRRPVVRDLLADVHHPWLWIRTFAGGPYRTVSVAVLRVGCARIHAGHLGCTRINSD